MSTTALSSLGAGVRSAPDGAARKTASKLLFLDGIRGLAALQVVLFHFIGLHALPRWGNLLFSWTKYGHFAVDMFITLSGFCLMLPVVRSGDGRLKGGVGNYLARRCRRILPPYYAALLIAILAVCLPPLRHTPILGFAWSTVVSPGNIIGHLLLIHNLFPSIADSPLDIAMWSIGTEWQIYFIFPLLLLPVWRKFGGAAAVLVGFGAGVVLHFALRGAIDFACPWYIGLFALGMVAAAWTESHPEGSPTQARVFLLAALALAAPYVGLKTLMRFSPLADPSAVEWIKDMLGGGISVCVILYLASLEKMSDTNARLPLALRFMQSKILLAVGAFSYSLYLVHCIVLNYTQYLLSRAGLSLTEMMMARLLLAIPAALLLSYLFHLAFERPFMPGRPVTERQAELAAVVSPAP